jgi:hypothetical protein
VVWLQCRRRDGIGAPKTVLGIDRILIDLADDAEIVQCVGEVRIKRAETCLLQDGSLT